MLNSLEIRSSGGVCAAVTRPAIRCVDANALWALKWQEHFSLGTVAIQFVVPLIQDFSAKLEKRLEKEDEVIALLPLTR